MKNIDFTDFFNVFLSGATIRANPPTAVRAPRSSGAEEEPPRQGEHADAVRAPPAFRCRKGAAPLGANTPAAVRAPRSAGAEKFLENFQKS